MRLQYLMPKPPSRSTGQATYGMSNLRSDKTGLPFIVFVSQQDGASHSARVKWSAGPKVQADQMGTYSLSPFKHRGGLKLSPRDEKLLRDWIEKNIDTLQKYWTGEIGFTEEMLSLLKQI